MNSENLVALDLINDCIRNKNAFLDIGKLGLKQIPMEVSQLSWLEGLNLGDGYFDDNNNWVSCPQDYVDVFSRNMSGNTFRFSYGEFTYEVDLSRNTQKNTRTDKVRSIHVQY